MGDEPTLRQNSISNDSDESLAGERFPLHSLSVTNPHTVQATNIEFESYPRQHFNMGHFPVGGTLEMSNMASALQDYQMRQYQQQSFPPHYQLLAATNQSMMYQYHEGAQFAGQTASNYNHPIAQQNPSHFMQSPQQHAPYAHYMDTPGGPCGPQNFQNQAFVLQQSMLHNPHTTAQHQQSQLAQYPQSPAYMSTYSARITPAYPIPQLRLDNSLPQPQAPNFYEPPNSQVVRRTSSNSSLQMPVLRGPPRKPKQSGHALWVGNLPPATKIIDLKDHLSKDATEDIESVFLISKSNCAFVNYRTEASCAAAMARFHDSRFQGVRLVCRLRRGSTSTATQASNTVQQPTEPLEESQRHERSRDEQAGLADGAVLPEPETAGKVMEKYFVVKSLTVEDLKRSVHSGIWATQAHNEATLNNAYQTAENVYLIFSANKSGEYFGYARMESAIDDESAANIEYLPCLEAPDPGPSDLPLTIPTPATATAPQGRIIYDSARGTIFWEADVENKEREEPNTDDDGGNVSGEGYESASPTTPQIFGKPFKIKWMSTDRLPFYRTRGLRNPWNANREVKIARDGTEIEPSVGRRLVGMFHRLQMPAASPNSASQQPPLQGGMGRFMSPHGSAPGDIFGRVY